MFVSHSQIYHMCDGLGRQFSYTCPNTTLFQQRMLICDHWYMVNCSTSESDYSANLLIGQKEKKFVDDSDVKNTYQRTPRPDLLSHPSAPEYNIVYRRGKAYAGSNSNLIGVDTDFERNNGSKPTTDEPSYFVPSHWSTEYAKQQTTGKPGNRNDFSNNERRKPAYKPFAGTFAFNRERTTSTTTEPAEENEVTNSFQTEAPLDEVRINFKSNFKATTPQYPKVVDFVTPLPPGNELGLLPPKQEEQEAHVNFASNFKATTPQYPKVVDFTTPPPPADEIGLLPPEAPESHDEVRINFQSDFKATTPQYPKEVHIAVPIPSGDEIGLLPPEEPHSENDVHVNFESKFRATTPVYPKIVDFTTPLPPGEQIGLLPPFVPKIPQGFQTAKPEDLVLNVEPPSKFYQPPKLDKSQEAATQKAAASEIENSEQRWKDLRQVFLIPDYEFPLETASRISYDGKYSSFQVDAMGRIVSRE